MRNIFTAFRDYLWSYFKKDLDPIERLVFRERFLPLPVLVFLTLGLTLLALFIVLLFQIFTAPPPTLH